MAAQLVRMSKLLWHKGFRSRAETKPIDVVNAPEKFF